MCKSLSLCKQSERREDKVQRGNPLFKCQAVRAILSLPLSFPLFSTSHGSDSCCPSLPSNASCVFGHVGVTVHVPACASLSPRRWSCILGRRHESTSVSCANRVKPGRRSTRAGCLLLSKVAVCSLRRKNGERLKPCRSPLIRPGLCFFSSRFTLCRWTALTSCFCQLYVCLLSERKTKFSFSKMMD